MGRNDASLLGAVGRIGPAAGGGPDARGDAGSPLEDPAVERETGVQAGHREVTRRLAGTARRRASRAGPSRTDDGSGVLPFKAPRVRSAHTGAVTPAVTGCSAERTSTIT